MTRAPGRVGPVQVLIEGPDAGPVMLVLHGTPGDWRQCETVSRAYRDRFRVLRPSRPGYGRTALKRGRTVHEQADLMVGLLDDLGIDRALVMGVSGGGPFALALAADHPDRCTGLILCCAVAAPVMPISAPSVRLAAGRGVLDPVSTPLGRMLGRLQVRAHERDVVADLSPAEYADWQRDPEPVARYARDTVQVTALAGIRNDIRQFQLREPLTTDVPTLVVHGDADPVVPVSCAEHHAAVLPNASLVLLPGRTHALPITAAAPFTAAVDEWLPVVQIT